MKTRTTIFDQYTSAAVSFLEQAVNNGGKRDVPRDYIERFCDITLQLLWSDVDSAIMSQELYGDAEGFEFNLGGYIDTYYENDGIRWRGWTAKQVEGLKECYPRIVQLFRDAALDIIEMYLRSICDSHVERAKRWVEWKHTEFGGGGTFRNLEKIAWLCLDAKPTAEKVYDIFLKKAQRLQHFDE